MTKRTLLLSITVAILAVVSACNRAADTSNLKEIQKQRSGEYVVSLLNDSGQLKQGKNDFVLEVREASDNQLVDVGAIQASTSMPMPGTANMVGEMSVSPSGTKGRYNVSSTLPMQGQWTTALTFQNGQKTQFALRTQ